MGRVYYFSLPGITCINCIYPVKIALKNFQKFPITHITEDVLEKTIAVTVQDKTEFEPEEINRSLKETIEAVGVDCLEMGHAELDNKTQNPLSHLLKGIGGVSFGIAIMLLMMSGIGIPILVMYGLMALASALTVYLGASSYYDSIKKLIKSKTLTMDTLFTISSLTVIGVSIISFFVPWMPMMMEAGLMIFGFRHLGKFIEESLKQKVLSGLKFTQRAPRSIKKFNSQNELEEVPLKSVQPDDIVFIPNGETIFVDGECLCENAAIYDTLLTGDTLPQTIKSGEKILAGMKAANLAGIRLRVTQTVDHSYLARLDEKILQANVEKAPIETITNKILQYFIPGVLAAAAITGIVVGCLFNPALAIQCAATVLVSACPCTLGFITPLSIKIGIAKAREQGVQFKSDKALQTAAQIDTVLFDLNGTLTTGEFVPYRYKIFSSSKMTPYDFFNLLASIESYAQHPIAKAIIDFTQKKNIACSLNNSLTDIDLSSHSGIAATFNGDRIIVGNQSMLAQSGVDTSALQMKLQQQHAGQVIFMAKNNSIIGYLLLKDSLRPGAEQTVSELMHMGKEVHLVTGADQRTAEYYAKELKISPSHIFADCLGASDQSNKHVKTEYIEMLQKRGRRVAMIGDAANDALAIAKSDFGIAVKSNAADEITQQQAGAVINNRSLQPVLTTFAVAKKTVRNITENLAMSLTYNCGVMILGSLAIALGFAINPGLGVALMILQTTIVLLNQYRFKKQATIKAGTTTYAKLREQTLPNSSYKNLFQSGLEIIPSPKIVKEKDSTVLLCHSSNLISPTPTSSYVPCSPSLR